MVLILIKTENFLFLSEKMQGNDWFTDSDKNNLSQEAEWCEAKIDLA